MIAKNEKQSFVEMKPIDQIIVVTIIIIKIEFGIVLKLNNNIYYTILPCYLIFGK